MATNNPPKYTEKPNYYDQQPTVTVLQQPYNPEEKTGPNWEYLKTASCIVRIILMVLLLVAVILMAKASLLNLLIELSGNSLDELKIIFDTLKLLRNLFISFTCILLAIQLLKICLNVANLGDYVQTTNSTARCINILIAVAEGLLFFALIGVSGYFSIVGIFFLFYDPDFGVAMIMIDVSAIWRAILGCVECCCKSRQTQMRQPVVIMTTRS